MEILMRQFVTQLRPRNETYIRPIDKIQQLLTELRLGQIKGYEDWVMEI